MDEDFIEIIDRRTAPALTSYGTLIAEEPLPSAEKTLFQTAIYNIEAHTLQSKFGDSSLHHHVREIGWVA